MNIISLFQTKSEALPSFAAGGREQLLTVVRSPRARHMRLAVDPKTHKVRLTLPQGGNLREALQWVETKRTWVEAQMAAQPNSQPIVPGMRIPLPNGPLTLDWHQTNPRNPRIVGNNLQIGGPLETISSRLLRWLQAEARHLLAKETAEFASLAGVYVTQTTVGDATSRWGSCSSSGTIRYNWRLILAPDFVRRATVAHEVAHRIHMNHSKAFHAKVAEILGADPKPARDWLKANGTALHCFGRE